MNLLAIHIPANIRSEEMKSIGYTMRPTGPMGNKMSPPARLSRPTKNPDLGSKKQEGNYYRYLAKLKVTTWIENSGDSDSIQSYSNSSKSDY